MRVRPVTDALQSFQRVSDKQDKGSHNDRSSDQSGQEKKDEGFQRETPPTVEAINEAMDAFVAEKATLDSGLSVSLDGQGPGLKVVLKDGKGAIVRQMTGDEFVKLRETVSNDPKSRGKILDQKL